MHLYLIRHGIAAEPEEYPTDAERQLTKEGASKTRKVAQRLYELEIQFDLILTSPKAGAIGLILPETGSPVGRSQMFCLLSPKFLLG